MSKFSSISYTCPSCQRKSLFTVWQSINTEINPELKPKILDESLFIFCCKYCGNNQDVGYAFLYHDPQKQYMIWWIPPDKHGIQNFNQNELDNQAKLMNDYRLRLVPSLKRLIEKISIFDFDLDDRVIEILKYFIWSIHLKDKGIKQESIFFINAQLDDVYPNITLLFNTLSGQEKLIEVTGKMGYPRALEMLQQAEKNKYYVNGWKTIDNTFWSQTIK